MIHARDLYKYFFSPFLLWCDFFAPKGEKDPEDEYQQLLMQRGNEHEAAVIASQYAFSERLEGTHEERFKEGLKLMKQGVGALAGMPLLFPEYRGVTDLLERKEGKSKLGDYHYVVKEIKLARNLKEKHVFQAAFYNMLLGKVQGVVPEQFFMINMDGEEFSYYSKGREWRLQYKTK